MAGKAATAEAPEVVERALGEGAFSVERFVESFPALVEAAGGIDRMRGLLIEIAVRGRLCRPTKTDELVDRQLARILEEKTKGPRNKAGAAISTVDAPPFDIPSHWRWIRWGDLVLSTGSGWSPQCENRPRQEGEWGVLKVSAVSWLAFQPEENKTLPMGVEPRIEFAAHAGDFLMSRANTAELVGRSVIVPTEPKRLLLSDKLVRCTFSKHIEQQYVNLYNRTPTARAHYLTHASGTSESMKNISREVILSMPVPLPPLAEQKRIVARVDQLMALIDQLEAKQNRKRDLGARFTKASLEALTTAESPQSLTTAWTRLQSTWPTILDHPDKVEGVRRAILDMAIRGKLTRQNCEDESAVSLRDRIRARCGIRDPRNSDASEAPFSLPAGWCWASLPELGEFGRGKSKHRPRNDPKLFRDGKFPMVQTGDIARSNGSVTTYTALYGELGLAQSRLWPKGTLCITIAANIADTGILTFDACFPDSVVGFVPDSEIRDTRYFEYFLRTAKQHIEDFAPATAQKNINLEILSAVLVPLPPKAEMGRIVAKVDHLMKLCDALEAALRRREGRAARLAEAVVQEMVA